MPRHSPLTLTLFSQCALSPLLHFGSAVRGNGQPALGRLLLRCTALPRLLHMSKNGAGGLRGAGRWAGSCIVSPSSGFRGLACALPLGREGIANVGPSLVLRKPPAEKNFWGGMNSFILKRLPLPNGKNHARNGALSTGKRRLKFAKKWRMPESNRRPPACKAGALAS